VPCASTTCRIDSDEKVGATIGSKNAFSPTGGQSDLTGGMIFIREAVRELRLPRDAPRQAGPPVTDYVQTANQTQHQPDSAPVPKEGR
jgi:hypothetical protein